MESDEETQDLLRVVERAEAAPWAAYPPTPRWYPPLTGLWAGGMVAATGLILGEHWQGLVVVAVLVLLEVLFVRWYRRYHGAVPTLRRPPQEMRPVLRGFVVGSAVLVVMVAACWLLAGAYVAAVATAVLVTAAITAYEVAFARASARLRRRLA